PDRAPRCSPTSARLLRRRSERRPLSNSGPARLRTFRCSPASISLLRRRPGRRLLSTCCAARDSASLPLTGHDKQGHKWFYAMVHFKNRYMVMEVFIDASRGEADPVILTQFNITKVIRDSIQLNFGECGLAASLGSLQVKYVNPVTKLCVIRVSREDHQKVWAAITMVRSIGKIPVSFNLLDEVSGPARKPRWSAKKRSLSSTSWQLVIV
uniref:Uncharacterized protein n=2 Tax=Aegilops tauschii subsp. strangulata TaxID=200361 RepID=A0A453BRE2_AEGTS